jgi:hypothetical protein
LAQKIPIRKNPWLGIHLLMTKSDTTEQLTDAVKDLAQLGVNTIVAEIDYGYEYQSHPNLRSPHASRRSPRQPLLKHWTGKRPVIILRGHRESKGKVEQIGLSKILRKGD